MTIRGGIGERHKVYGKVDNAFEMLNGASEKLSEDGKPSGDRAHLKMDKRCAKKAGV